jgi:hypothetical protein
MANNRFIYPNSDGTASVYMPTDPFLAKLSGTIDEKLIYCANKDLPTGTKYELIDESVDLSDRTFRNAWTYTADASVEKTSADLNAEQLARHDMKENK